MNEKTRALLLDTEKCALKEVLIDKGDHLEQFYRLLQCRTIDSIERYVGGRAYDIIVDDEGTFLEHPIISAIDGKGKPMLVGNLLFCKYDRTGRMISLPDEEIGFLKCHTDIGMQSSKEGNFFKRVLVMRDVEYFPHEDMVNQFIA